MRSANGTAPEEDVRPPIRFAGRSFVVASNQPTEALRALEREIEARGGSIHPFLNAVTEVLVVGDLAGMDSGAHWAREQVRRGTIYRDRWGHLELISEEELRAALVESRRGRASGSPFDDRSIADGA
ncbi:MAG: hypothetical protein RBU36_04210 [Thermoanaerobaculia bacterium]|jgi:hypothetical protein|nr:hypothetical protein [Thermoanaerobaculia bacterium]